jgi:hypothetical protein
MEIAACSPRAEVEASWRTRGDDAALNHGSKPDLELTNFICGL